jgi:hypothetical protein
MIHPVPGRATLTSGQVPLRDQPAPPLQDVVSDNDASTPVTVRRPRSDSSQPSSNPKASGTSSR